MEKEKERVEKKLKIKILNGFNRPRLLEIGEKGDRPGDGMANRAKAELSSRAFIVL